MLYVVTYNHHYSLYDLAFLATNDETIVVAPTPSVADMLREKIERPDTETETIAHFIKKMFDKESQGRFFTKSKYYLFLSIIWKKLGKSLNHSEFDNLFNVFTELRSYTLDYELINDIFSEEELANKDVIEYFWQVTEDSQIIDEQKSYQLFIQSDLKSLHNKNILFWGFKHFSGLQIDLLKHLATIANVYIPIPKTIYHGKKNQIDWTSWLVLDQTLIEIADEQTVDNSTQIICYTKNRLNQTLLKVPPNDLFIVSDDFTLLNSLEIPSTNFHFKTSIDLFKEDEEQLFKEFYSYVKKDLPIDIDAIIKETLKQKNFKKLKIVSLFKELLSTYTKFGDEQVVEFDLKVLRYCTNLDLPRNFVIPVNEANVMAVKTKEDFNFAEKNQNKSIIFFEEANGSKSNNTLSDIQKKMKNISPIRNHRLDFNFLKHSLYDITSQGKNYLFIPEDFLENSFDYADILNEITQNRVSDKILNSRKVVVDTLSITNAIISKPSKKISYTYLQTFLDCPRKFYYKYIDKIDLRIDLSLELAPHEIGRLEHEIIGAYFKSGEKTYKDLVHDKITEELLQTFLKLQNKHIDLISNQFNKIELMLNTKEPILFLLEFTEQIHFERPIVKSGYAGSVDVTLASGFFDFKRSKFSIPTRRDILEFEAIQLPFYLAHSEVASQVMGYLNIANLSESLVFIFENCDESLKKIFDKYQIKTHSLDFIEIKNKYEDFEKGLVEKIHKEEKFIPHPKNPEACRYCDLKAVCYAKL